MAWLDGGGEVGSSSSSSRFDDLNDGHVIHELLHGHLDNVNEARSSHTVVSRSVGEKTSEIEKAIS